MKRENMQISIIIPTHNRASLLKEAIQSVLAQHTEGLEVVVVDDGSSDQTASVVRAFGPPVYYVQQAQAGPGAARNLGLRITTGEIVGFLDDDDLWAPDKLNVQLPKLLDKPGPDLVLGFTQRMIWKNDSSGGGQFVDYREPVKLYSLGCALFHRRVFERVGLFDEKMRFAEDDDWFMRAKSMDLALLFLPQVSQYYRFHENNMTHDKKARLTDMLRLVKNRLDRQRNEQNES